MMMGAVAGLGVIGVADDNEVEDEENVFRSGVGGRAIDGIGGDGFVVAELRAADDAFEGRRPLPGRREGGTPGWF